MADKLFPTDYTEVTSPLATDFTPLFREGDDMYKIKTENLKGDKGDDGDAGKGITSVIKTNTVGLVDTYTITFTDSTTTTFDITNGEAGEDGKGISTIELISTVGKVKTYRITFTDATTFDFVVTDGTDGTGSGDISGSGTANEIAYFTAEKTIDNLPVATYPSLMELSYVKGVTSAIQTQINGKQASGSYEVITNKETSALDTSTSKYPCNNVVKTAVDGKSPIDSPVFTTKIQTPTIELGHATDTTLSRVSAGVIAVEGVTIPTISSTDTLTNKRINPRVVSASSYTTDTGTSLTIATCDMFEITAQAGALKFNNPLGTPVDGNTIKVRIKDNGTARALTYDTQFRAIGTTLPTTTVISKTLYMGFIYNSADTKRDCIATAQEA